MAVDPKEAELVILNEPPYGEDLRTIFKEQGLDPRRERLDPGWDLNVCFYETVGSLEEQEILRLGGELENRARSRSTRGRMVATSRVHQKAPRAPSLG